MNNKNIRVLIDEAKGLKKDYNTKLKKIQDEFLEVIS